MEQSRLRELENLCIQDCAPPCASRCPVHVDVRQLTLAISTGNYLGGYQIFVKSVPFPNIIARTCNRSCQEKCNRSTLGGAIQVADLERACLKYSTQPPIKYTILPRKKSRVVVIGGGLSGLTAAFDLARKGYLVDLFEQQDHLGGQLWNFPENQLPRDILLIDVSLISQIGVNIHLGEKVDSHHKIISEADAIYLAVGKLDSDFSILGLARNDILKIDPITFQTNENKVFAGGSLLHPYSSILSISDGRRAAISIDRFLQKVSLTASRTNEGIYDSRLFTNVSGISHKEAISPQDKIAGYTKEEAQAEANRCLQCECMECVKACEYLKHYGSYPKRYVRDIYNNLSMLVRARTANTFINTCALCGLCGELCPNNLDMGGVTQETRQVMVKTSRMPFATHDFALRDMAFSNGSKFSLAKNAPGYNQSTYVFFPGCQLSGSYPNYVEKAYDFLRDIYRKEKASVGLILRCCGAPADWAGREDLFTNSQSEFMTEYEKLGKPKVILACSSCYQIFQKHFPHIEILSFWDIYDQYGFSDSNKISNLDKPRFPKLSSHVAVHDPCSTRYESHIQESVRNILQKLGCKITELPMSRERTECCTYGGLMWLANKPVAEKMVQRRINESPLDYVTYCAMCRDFFARRGKRTLHLFDYIFGDTETDLATLPAKGFSQRHENRTRLKQKLLKDLWDEKMPEQETFESIRLILPDEVQNQIEDRLILFEDIQKVIEHAERTGKRMFNNSTNHYLAYFKPVSVTYWVEYTPQEDGSFFVHKAYSHRMEIGRISQP